MTEPLFSETISTRDGVNRLTFSIEFMVDDKAVAKTGASKVAVVMLETRGVTRTTVER
jgi:hypothetical protein